MKLQQLKCFIAVVEEGTFTKAAERVHLTQPGLSRHIRHLEERLDVQLFERGRKVKLTAAGQAFLPEARHVLERATQLREQVRNGQLSEAREVPHNLPTRKHQLLGREKDLKQIQYSFNQTRLLTLTGSPGVGKTRLALEAAHSLKNSFSDGVWWVDATPLHEANQVVENALAISGGSRQPDQNTLQALQHHLHEKSVLLVLDNLEHLLALAPNLETLVQNCSRLSLLITSREVLKQPSEHFIRLEPLALPATSSISASEATSYAALALFLERAQAVRPTFIFNDNNASVIAELCTYLDGLPLALELTAARINLLAPAELLARLKTHHVIPKPVVASTHQRHETLERALAWSYNLLSPEEQTVFKSIGVFVGGFTLAAAEAVTQGDVDIVVGLAKLLDHNLVYVQDAFDNEVRFGLLESIRVYSLKQLERDPACETAFKRHAEFYLGLAERARSEMEKQAQATGVKRTQQDYDNLRAALTWSIQGGSERQELGFKLVMILQRYWLVQGHGGEAWQWINPLLEQPTDGYSFAHARALNTAGVLAATEERHTQAKAYFEEALAAFKDMQNTKEQAGLLVNLGVFHSRLGEVVMAKTRYTEALEVLGEQGEPHIRAIALGNLATVMRDLGDSKAELDLTLQSLSLHRSLGDPTRVGMDLLNLAGIYLRRDDFDRADEYYQEANYLSVTIADQRNVAHVKAGQAVLELLRGRNTLATEYGLACLQLCQVLGGEANLAAIACRVMVVANNKSLQTAQLVNLLGFAYGLAQDNGHSLPPRYIRIQDAAVADLQTRLGSHYQVLLEQGRYMSMPDVLEKVSVLAGHHSNDADRKNALLQYS